MKTKPVPVQIKPQHLLQGTPSNSISCAFALALTERFPGFRYVEVQGPDDIRAVGNNTAWNAPTYQIMPIPEEQKALTEFIDWFDTDYGTEYDEGLDVWKGEQGLTVHVTIEQEDNSNYEVATEVDRFVANH